MIIEKFMAFLDKNCHQKRISNFLQNKSIKTEAFECYSYSLVLVFLLLPRFKKITRLIGLNKLNLDSKKIIF